MITRSHSKDLPKLRPGDLVTFIEGDSWIFIDKEGEEMKSPPVGVVLSQFDHIGIRVFWSTGEITMEWRSQIQLYSKYEEMKGIQKLNRKKLKLGDMVDFRSPFFGATTNKQRPGIIVEIEDKEPDLWEYHKNRISCKVLWANGRTTNEYYSLLEHYDDIPRFS